MAMHGQTMNGLPRPGEWNDVIGDAQAGHVTVSNGQRGCPGAVGRLENAQLSRYLWLRRLCGGFLLARCGTHGTVNRSMEIYLGSRLSRLQGNFVGPIDVNCHHYLTKHIWVGVGLGLVSCEAGIV